MKARLKYSYKVWIKAAHLNVISPISEKISAWSLCVYKCVGGGWENGNLLSGEENISWHTNPCTHTHTHTLSMWKYSRTSDAQNAQHFSVASECKSESESQREVEQRL